jgi:GPH family glycoside/pentoside/hexuronide:cation symporter
MREPGTDPRSTEASEAGVDRAALTAPASEWRTPSLGIKLSYAIPSFATAAMAAPLIIELKIFYTDTVLVPAGLLAVAMAIARAFDAITDPLMGWITDHTRTRWGRRKPWLPLGVPLCALFYWIMFLPPQSLSAQGGAVVWIGVAYCLYYLFHTVWSVPYAGLGFELSPDYDDRTSLFGYRSICGGLGLLLSFFLLYLTKARGTFSGDREMLAVLTGCFALLMVLLFVWPVLRVRERSEFATRARAPFVPGIRRALRNRPFRILLFASILGTIPATMPTLLMPYFTKYVLLVEDQWRLVFAGVYVISGFLSLPVWMGMARRIGKLPVWIITATIGIVSSFVLFTVGEGQTTRMLVLEVIRGFAAGAIVILGPAMMADVIDYDELRTGRRREAQFGAFLNLIPKFVAILGATLPLALMGAAGYDPTMPSLTAGATLAIRVLFALFPIAFHVGGLLILLRYPISREVHRAIRDGIARHRRGEDARDPITGHARPPADARTIGEETGWFLDNFSPRALRQILERGPGSVVRDVLTPVAVAALSSAAAIGAAAALLFDSLSRSQEDQLRQGMAACMVVVAGLAITALLYHLMRIRPARRMAADPVDAETIRAHLREAA